MLGLSGVLMIILVNTVQASWNWNTHLTNTAKDM